MCIIIDTNALASTFDATAVDHSEFKPIKKWIFEGKGKVIFGGSKFISETPPKYIRLYMELKNVNKAIIFDKEPIDEEVTKIESLVQDPDFDDPHLVALLRISKCKLICTNEKRAVPFLRHNLFFSPAKNKPRIYKSSKNISLISNDRISKCPCCSPTVVLTKAQKEGFSIEL